MSDTLKPGGISRRTFVKRSALFTVVLGGAPALLQACAAEAPSTPAPQPTQQPAAKPASTAAGPEATSVPKETTVSIKRGGSLVHGWVWGADTMDVHVSTRADNPAYTAMFNGLIRFRSTDPEKKKPEIVGDLAESWDQPDARTVIFKLRQGVKFHDGSDFDAEVAKWNYERVKDHPKSPLKASLAELESIEAVDKYTFRLRTKQDYAPLLNILAYGRGGQALMMSKAAFEKNGEDWVQRNAVGTGPFRFKQWITDDRVIAERNPDYFETGADGKPLPYLDEVTHRFIPDPATSVVDMRAGSLHVLQDPDQKDVSTIMADPNLTVVQHAWSGYIYFKVGFNTQAPPFNDVRVRQAALYGIDHAGMAETFGYGVGKPVYDPYWTEGTLGYDESIGRYEYDPAKTKELLTEAGYPDGVEIELMCAAREPERSIAEFAQQMWASVGIKAKLRIIERVATIDAVKAGDYQAYFWRSGVPLLTVIEPDFDRARITCGAPSNWGNWCNPEVDELMAQGAATLDPKERAKIYNQVWRIIYENAYAGVGYMLPTLLAHRKEVQGLEFNFTLPDYRRVWLKA